jgi:maleylacetate reductase
VAVHDFTWIDGERLIRFGDGVLREARGLLDERGFAGYVLLTTERAEREVPSAVLEGAAAVLHVPGGGVPEAAASVRDQVQGRPLVAFGGGRVIDSAKAIAGADGLPVAAIPTTLSGAEMTRIHRMPAGVEQFNLVRPSVVVAEAELMASQPMPDLAASAMNAVSHGLEATYTPFRNPVCDSAALHGIELIASALADEEPVRGLLALGSILCAYGIGSAGYAVEHVLCQTLVRVTGIGHSQAYSVMLPHTVRFMASRAPAPIGNLALALRAPRPDPELAAERAEELAAKSGVRTLTELGVTEDQLPEVVAVASERAELANTPGGRPEDDDLLDLLRRAL